MHEPEDLAMMVARGDGMTFKERQRAAELIRKNAAPQESLTRPGIVGARPADAALTGPGEQLAKDAVHAYREMQHELHGAPYYALSRQALDELAFAMQKVYRSPVQQEEEAVRRAKAACGATSVTRSKS